jgi:hypothetical protein
MSSIAPNGRSRMNELNGIVVEVVALFNKKKLYTAFHFIDPFYTPSGILHHDPNFI